MCFGKRQAVDIESNETRSCTDHWYYSMVLFILGIFFPPLLFIGSYWAFQNRDDAAKKWGVACVCLLLAYLFSAVLALALR